MTTYYVLRLRGIGETTNTMLEQITGRLPRDRFVCTEFREWLAEFGPFPHVAGRSYDWCLDDALMKVVRWVELAPGPVILMGYSGGAELAGNVAFWINARRPDLAAKVRFVVLVADPKRPRQVFLPGYGIRGERSIPGVIEVMWVSWDGDVITCCDPDSPWRTATDAVSGFSLVNPVAWGFGLYARLATRQLQAVIADRGNIDAVRRRYAKARSDFHGYIGGQHTVEYTRQRFGGSLLERAARDIAKEAV